MAREERSAPQDAPAKAGASSAALPGKTKLQGSLSFYPGFKIPMLVSLYAPGCPTANPDEHDTWCFHQEKPEAEICPFFSQAWARPDEQVTIICQHNDAIDEIDWPAV